MANDKPLGTCPPAERKTVLLREADAAEVRATYHDYYGRKTPGYFVEMRLARKLRELARKQ